MVTKQDFETLKQVLAQANPNPWTDFAGNGRSHRTHIGYQANTIDECGNPVNIALFETNTNAKRADVLLAIYARNYLAPLLNEVEQLRADNAVLADMYDEAVRARMENERRWIPVSERLPEERGHYLAAGKYLTGTAWVTKLYFDDDQEWYYGQSIRRSTTHWMPMPPAPDKQ